MPWNLCKILLCAPRPVPNPLLRTTSRMRMTQECPENSARRTTIASMSSMGGGAGGTFEPVFERAVHAGNRQRLFENPRGGMTVHILEQRNRRRRRHQVSARQAAAF